MKMKPVASIPHELQIVTLRGDQPECACSCGLWSIRLEGTYGWTDARIESEMEAEHGKHLAAVLAQHRSDNEKRRSLWRTVLRRLRAEITGKTNCKSRNQ